MQSGINKFPEYWEFRVAEFLGEDVDVDWSTGIMQMAMLDEAAKHLHEGIALGRTDIIKTLLEEVRASLAIEADPTAAGTSATRQSSAYRVTMVCFFIEGKNLSALYRDFLSRVRGPKGTFLHEAVQVRHRGIATDPVWGGCLSLLLFS